MLSDKTLDKLNQLVLSLRSHAQGGAGGVRRSKALGASAEFSDFREYAPGDDIRRIDWNAYARFDKLFLKLFMEEQEAVVTLILDGSRSMTDKWPAVCIVAQMIGYLALTGGDRVRILLLQDDKAVSSPLYSGRVAFRALSQWIEGVSPQGLTRLQDALRHTQSPFSKGISILVSDLLTEERLDAVLDYLLYQKQEITLLQLLTQEELSPTLNGAIRLWDSESNQKTELIIGADEIAAYQKALKHLTAEIDKACRKRAVSYRLLTCSAQEDELLRLMTDAALIGA